MALSSELEKALNQQLNGEYYSSYLYLQMAAHFEQDDLPGMSSWMRTQATEENVHAMKFFDHILQRDGVVTLTEILGPTGGVRLAAGGVRVRAEARAARHEGDRRALLGRRSADDPAAPVVRDRADRGGADGRADRRIAEDGRRRRAGVAAAGPRARRPNLADGAGRLSEQTRALDLTAEGIGLTGRSRRS